MATSTNYGWTEPNDSDLVTNGALAIRTLGNAIDTSLWNSGYGQAGKNKCIGSFNIWQRGTSFSSGASPIYTADRWAFNRAGGDVGATVSRQTTSDTTNLPFLQYCARVQRNSGTTAVTSVAFWQSLESVNSIPLAGQTVTFSFYARKGANYSSTSNILTAAFYTGTGTDQNINVTGYTGQVTTSNNATLTATWQRFSYQIAVPTTATEIGFIFSYTPTGTAGANDYYEVTGVQVEAGAKATPFQTASGGSIQGELAMCQRYYFDGRQGSDQAFSGYTNSTDYLLAMVRYPVTMRTTPSITIGQSSGVNYVRRISTNGQLAITVTSYPGSTPGGFGAVYASAAPFAAAVGYDFYILASAEL